jgi:hypothetical protein
MPRIPPLLAGSILTGGTALAAAWTWMHVTGSRTLTVGAVIVCAAISVTTVLVLEAVVRRVRRGRPRRAHARTHPKPRKDTTPA